MGDAHPPLGVWAGWMHYYQVLAQRKRGSHVPISHTDDCGELAPRAFYALPDDKKGLAVSD